jgi:hypothetical protein
VFWKLYCPTYFLMYWIYIFLLTYKLEIKIAYLNKADRVNPNRIQRVVRVVGEEVRLWTEAP